MDTDTPLVLHWCSILGKAVREMCAGGSALHRTRLQEGSVQCSMTSVRRVRTELHFLMGDILLMEEWGKENRSCSYC